MIGDFRIDPPPALASGFGHRLDELADEGWLPKAILYMGDLSADDPGLRLAAGYRHLGLTPDDGPAWLEVARLHAARGEMDAANAILDELDRLDAPGLYPGVYHESAAVHRLHFLADAGRADEALALSRTLADAHGDATVFQYILASVLHAAERFEAAADVYETALARLADQERAAAGDDDDGVDFDSVRRHLIRLRGEALEGTPFTGNRPFTLADLVNPGDLVSDDLNDD